MSRYDWIEEKSEEPELYIEDLQEGYSRVTVREADNNVFKTVILVDALEYIRNPVETLMDSRRVSRDKVLVCVPDEDRWNVSFEEFIGASSLRRYTGRILFDQCLKAGFPPECIKVDHINEIHSDEEEQRFICWWLAELSID